MRRALIAMFLFVTPTVAVAAAYFEFAPDYSEPLTVNVGTTVTQVFAPLNDHLASLELWISTGGTAAQLAFSLHDPAGAVISTGTVSLGSIADSSGGTRTMLTLPSQVSVEGAEPYRLDITPTGAAVKLYRSTSISLIPGSDGTGTSSYRYGRAIVGGEEQGYSFKFALTETSESTDPVISDILITQPSIGQAWLSLEASEPVDLQIAYGARSFGWTGQFTPCLPDVVRCTVALSVTPGVQYSYVLTAKDAWGNTATSAGSFTAVGEGPTEIASSTVSPAPSSSTVAPSPTTSSTPLPASTPPPAPDAEAPVISDPRLIGLTATSAIFAWKTDEAANSSVIMVGEGVFVFDGTQELEHYVIVGGLKPDHYYRARISSTDPWGNYSDVLIIFVTQQFVSPSPVPSGGTESPSPTPSFTVIMPDRSLPPPTTSPPSESPAPGSGSPSPTVTVLPPDDSGPGGIQWPPADGDIDGYRIDIFDAFGNLITSFSVSADVTSAQLPDDLPSDATIIVYADRDGAFQKVGAPTVISGRTFTPSSPLFRPTAPVIVGGIAAILALSIIWLTVRRRAKAAAASAVTIIPGAGQAV